MKPVQVKTRIRPQHRDEIKRIAERDEQSLADVLRRFIREGLEREAKTRKDSP